MQLPIAKHVPLIVRFAELPLVWERYEKLADELSMEVVRAADTGRGFDVLRKDDLFIMWAGSIVRAHAVSYLDDPEDVPPDSGIAAASSMNEMSEAFSTLRAQLVDRLGPPAGQGEWTAECMIEERPVTFQYCHWMMAETVLVLLLNDEGDGHIGEVATLDLRIAHRSAASDLPRQVQHLLGWP